MQLPFGCCNRYPGARCQLGHNPYKETLTTKSDSDRREEVEVKVLAEEEATVRRAEDTRDRTTDIVRTDVRRMRGSR